MSPNGGLALVGEKRRPAAERPEAVLDPFARKARRNLWGLAKIIMALVLWGVLYGAWAILRPSLG